MTEVVKEMRALIQEILHVACAKYSLWQSSPTSGLPMGKLFGTNRRRSERQVTGTFKQQVPWVGWTHEPLLAINLAAESLWFQNQGRQSFLVLAGSLHSGGYTNNNYTCNPVVLIMLMWWMALHHVGRKWYLMRAGRTYQYKSCPENRKTLDGLTTHALNYILYRRYGSK